MQNKRAKFQINPASGQSYVVEASSLDAVTSQIKRNGKRNLFGVERVDGAGKAKFFLDRGTGPLWPISVRSAHVELGMGGF